MPTYVDFVPVYLLSQIACAMWLELARIVCLNLESLLASAAASISVVNVFEKNLFSSDRDSMYLFSDPLESRCLE